MRPAFTSTRGAAAFGLLLLVLLTLPLVYPKSWLPPREEVYSSVPWANGAFPYLAQQIFEEKGDIDVAFMGSSRIWWDIDTPYVQRQLSTQLGRPVVVRSLGWDTAGFDPLYFVMRDLLEHRKVHMIVFSDCSVGAANTAHPLAPAWFRYPEDSDALNGLSARAKLSFYTSSLLGMPRTLLSRLRPNLPVIPSDEVSWPGFPHMKNPANRLGSLALRQRFDQPFVDFTPHTTTQPSDVRVYSEQNPGEFRFGPALVSDMQAAFVAKIGALAREHQVRLVYLHLPDTDDPQTALIQEPVFWPKLVGTDLPMAGITSDKLFAGLEHESILQLFYNHEHLNENGQKYFTPLITPTLLRIYADETQP